MYRKDETGEIYLRLDREDGPTIGFGGYATEEDMAKVWGKAEGKGLPANHPELRVQKVTPEGEVITLRYMGRDIDSIKCGDVVDVSLNANCGKIFVGIKERELVLVYASLRLFVEEWEDE